MEQESRRAGMNHSMWIISGCCGWIIGIGISRGEAGILFPGIITLIVCLLIAGGVLNP